MMKNLGTVEIGPFQLDSFCEEAESATSCADYNFEISIYVRSTNPNDKFLLVRHIGHDLCSYLCDLHSFIRGMTLTNMHS